MYSGYFLFSGLIALGKNTDNVIMHKDYKFLLLLTTCLSVLVHFFMKEIGATAINYFSVAAVLFPFSHPNQEFSVVTTSICFISAALVFMSLFANKGKVNTLVGYVIIILSFFYIGINSVVGIRAIYAEMASAVNFPIYNEEFSEINTYLDDAKPTVLYVYARDGYVGFSFQLFQQDIEVVTVFSLDEIAERESGYILVSNEEVWEGEDYYKVMETANYRLFSFE